MATRTIAVKMTLDAGETVSEVNKVEQSLKGVDEQINDIAADSKKIKTIEDRYKDLNKAVASGELSQRQLAKAVKEYMTIALQAGEESPIGKKALQEAGQLKDRLSDLSASVDGLSKDGRGLQTALQLGQGVLGGYSAFQGIVALTGTENENLTKTIMKLQAAQSALMGIESLHASLQKETLLRKKLDSYWTGIQTAATSAYTLVVGTSTGALKLFKLALVSTGIGALIVGLGLLIANFESVAKWIKETANLLLGWFGLVDLEQQKAEEATVAQTSALKQQSAQRLKDIEELREAEAKAHASRQKAFDLEIARMEAEGKSSRELKLAKIQDLLDEQKAILESNTAKIQVWVDYYTQLAALRGQSNEEFKASMLKQGVDLDALQKQSEEMLQSNRDAVYSAETELIALKNQFRDEDRKAGEQALADKKKLLEKEADDRKKFQDELDKIFAEQKAEEEKRLQELYDRTLAANKKLHELRIEESESLYDDLQLAHELRMEGLDETIPAENELRLYYEDLYLKEKQALTDKYAEEQKEKEEAEDEARKERNKQILESTIELASAINDFANQIGENRINKIQQNAKKELQVQGLSAQQKYAIELKAAQETDKIAKRIFNRNKAFNIANAVMDTASAITKSVAASPVTFGLPFSAFAAATGAFQIATIAAQQFEGTASNITPPSFSTGGGSASGGGGSSNESTQTGDANTGVTTNINPLINKVVVVETDITDSVTKVAKMEQIATL